MTARWTAFLDGAARLSAQQWLLRAGAPVGAGLVLLLHHGAGGAVQPWFLGLTLAQALLVAALPDSSAGLFLVLLLGVHWALYVPDGATLTPWSLAAALVLLAMHLAVTLATYGPPSLMLPGRLVLRWVRRGLGVAGGTVAVWLLARFFPAWPGTAAWAAGIGLALVLAWVLWLTRQLGPRG